MCVFVLRVLKDKCSDVWRSSMNLVQIVFTQTGNGMGFPHDFSGCHQEYCCHWHDAILTFRFSKYACWSVQYTPAFTFLVLVPLYSVCVFYFIPPLCYIIYVKILGYCLWFIITPPHTQIRHTHSFPIACRRKLTGFSSEQPGFLIPCHRSVTVLTVLDRHRSLSLSLSIYVSLSSLFISASR